MFNPMISNLVIILFGFLIGVILVASLRLKTTSPPYKECREKKENISCHLVHLIKLIKENPVFILFFNLIAMFIVLFLFSPIQINWLILLTSLLTGFMVSNKIFSLAKTGKIRVSGKTYLDIGPIQFNNFARKIGEQEIRKGVILDNYKWRVFIDEPDKVLDKIEYVEYLLHYTFSPPHRRINDRKSKFALDEEGYGSFVIDIKVKFKNGTEGSYTYFLDLSKQWPE